MHKGHRAKRFARIALPLATVVVLVAATSGCDGTSPLRAFPTMHLLDGHEIYVYGQYAANATITVVQCSTGADSMDDCNNESATTARTDSAGHFSAGAFVDSTFVDGHGVSIDCRSGRACEIVSVDNPAGFLGKRTAPLEFSDRDGLSVTPNRDLADGQVVTVQGRSSTGSAKVIQCPWSVGSVNDYTLCDLTTLTFPEVHSDGTFQAEITVHRILVGDKVTQPECFIPGNCILAADTGEGMEIVSPQWAPLEFN